MLSTMMNNKMGKVGGEFYDPSTDPNANTGAFDPGGNGMYQPSSNTSPPVDTSSTQPIEPNQSTNWGNMLAPLATAAIDNNNVQNTQADTNNYMSQGIPVSTAQRQAAQTRYQGLQDGTINASSDPAFQAATNLADQNISRTMAARGMNLSGNELGALRGNDLAAYSTWRQNELTRSQQDAGYNFNPSSTANAGLLSAQFMATMRNNRNSAATNNATTANNNNPNGSTPLSNGINTAINSLKPGSSTPNIPNSNTNTPWTGTPDYNGPQDYSGSGLDPNGTGAWNPVDTSSYVDPNNTMPDLSNVNMSPDLSSIFEGW